MNKIKICFIQTNVYHFFKNNLNNIYGGSELQLYLISKALSKDDKFIITYIIGNFGQNTVEEINNIKFYKSANPRPDDNLLIKFYQAIMYYKLLKKINADIYFTSTANSLVGIVSFFCKRNNKKHIHRTAHIMDVDKSYIRNNGLLGKIYKYGLEKSDIVITQCNDHKELLKINHNINSIIFKNSFEIKNKEDINKQFILWVARYEKWKQPEIFLKLANKFPKEKFIMICNKNNNHEKEWENLSKHASGIQNITFLEKVSINKIQDFFNKAKIFVNTSEYEGFPNTFIQAGIGKTPIISLNVNPDNFLDEYYCGYYCNNNFDLMVKKMKVLLINRTDYKTKSINMFNYIKKNNDIKKNIVELRSIIIKLLENENYSYSS